MIESLLNKWMIFQKDKRVLFIFLFCLFLAYGVHVALQSEVEAFPEFTNVQTQVITQFNGKAAEEVERQITIPLEVATTGLPGLINQRSVSMFGLSVITLTFDDNVKGRQARLDVSQRLGEAELPDGIRASLSPDSTPVGEIFRYTVTGPLPVDELRLIEDWQLEREFKSIPGVADVVSFGGPKRTIEVKLDVPRMKVLGLSVTSVAQALGQNHANAGGAMITHGEEGFVVRSIGLFEKPENLESAVVATQKGIPVRIRDIGSVQLGHKARLGSVGQDENDDVVEGIILLRQGSDSLKACASIREKIEKLNASALPKGVVIRPHYDRTKLIERSTYTVFHNIIFGVVLVCFLLFTGLGRRYWQMILAIALIIPFSLLMVFVGLKLLGYTPNLISLGAVDFGIIIETAIFAAEAVIASKRNQNRKDQGNSESVKVFANVLSPALLCALLLVVAFIPILSLQRVEGRIFRPLGITLIAALIGGQLGTLIFIPLAAAFCPQGKFSASRIDSFFNALLLKCEAVGKSLLKLKRPILTFGLVLLFVNFAVMFGIGREFLPQLNEGALYIRATTPATISIEASTELASRIRKKLKEIPEVTDVVSQIGRPDDGTDVNGFDNIEIFVAMLPPDQWRSAKTIDGFNKIAQEKLKAIEGVEFNYSQPIKDNVDEAISGVKGELVVKVFGPDLGELQKLGNQISEVIATISGAEDVGVERLLGQPELRFQMNRDLLARYGLRVTDAEEVLETALMGKIAAKLVDEQGRSVDIIVRPAIADPPTLNILTALPILTPGGAKVPLGEVSNPSLVEGVGRIYRESGERRIAVKCSVRNRAVVGFVDEANKKIKEKLNLPPKYKLQWSGSFDNAERASEQLMLVVPLCILTMIMLLFTWFNSWRVVGYLLWEIPFSALGGFLFLRLFGLNFSISAAAGGIVLVGVSFLTAMMLVAEWLHRGDIWLALKEKGKSILISSGVAIIGLVPAAFSHEIGSETAKPFAVMILGGLISSLVLSLFVLPAIISTHKEARK